jgi:hypothetical protein
MSQNTSIAPKCLSIYTSSGTIPLVCTQRQHIFHTSLGMISPNRLLMSKPTLLLGLPNMMWPTFMPTSSSNTSHTHRRASKLEYKFFFSNWGSEAPASTSIDAHSHEYKWLKLVPMLSPYVPCRASSPTRENIVVGPELGSLSPIIVS